MAGESRHERPVRRGRVDDTGGDVEGGQKLYYHLTLLAETIEGYRNLCSCRRRPTSRATTTSPASTGSCSSATTTASSPRPAASAASCSRRCWPATSTEAEQLAARLQDIFGRDNLFVELQDHGIADQHRTNPQLIEIARRLDAPLLATNDSHYTHREDAVAHDALLCVQTGAPLDDPNRFKFEGTEHYLKSAAEMRHLFREVPEACDNTLLIAERADVADRARQAEPARVPGARTGSAARPTRSGRSPTSATSTYEGARRALRRPAAARGGRSASTTSSASSATWASPPTSSSCGTSSATPASRASGSGPGRGSAAGCCVAYCLRIVDLDPIRYDLLFERFLNPGRKQMPDIDMDFDERYRAEMIRYAAERYGSDRVAQIVTFSTIKARAAVRDAARVLG